MNTKNSNTKVSKSPILELVQNRLDANIHYWHPEDKDWLEGRKAIWKILLPHIRSLDMFHFLKKKEYAILKHWFFTGQIDYANEIHKVRHEILSNFLLFYFWFFPEKLTSEIFQLLLETQVGVYGYPDGVLISDLRTLPPPYGLMGGREQSFIELFFPDTYWKETLVVGTKSILKDGRIMSKEVNTGIKPTALLRSFCGGTRRLLTDSQYNPHDFSQYIWDRFDCNYKYHFDEFGDSTLSAALERDPDNSRLIIKLPVGSYPLAKVLNLVHGFYEREDTLKESEVSVNIREKLYERFESGGFCDGLQNLWEDLKYSCIHNTEFDWNK